MPWAAMSDDTHCDERTHKAGGEAMGLWAVCRSWVADRLTDGFIPASTARAQALSLEIADPEAAIAKLVASGRWEVVEGGYRDVDYLDNNPTRAVVESRRAATAARVGAFREKRKMHKTPTSSDSNGVTNAVTNGVSNAGSNAVGNGPVTLAPLPLSPSGRSHTHSAGAYVPNQREPSDPLARDLLAELRKHPPLADVATPALAEQLAGDAQTAAKRPVDVVRAIGDAAREAGAQAAIGQPLPTSKLTSMVSRYCSRARPEAPPATSGQRAPVPVPRPGPPLPDKPFRAPRPTPVADPTPKSPPAGSQAAQ